MVAQQHEEDLDGDRKTTRVAIRLSRQQANQLDRAVAITGQTKTEFIAQAIAERAEDVFYNQRVLELTDRDTDTLLRALESPGEPNDAMRRGLAKLRQHQVNE